MTRVLIAYPGPTHSTYDVATGYDHALRDIGMTVASFQYHNYIRFYTEAIAHWQTVGLSDYEPTEQDAFQLAAERLALHVVDFVPDVVLVIAGGALHKRAHDLVHRLCVPMILLCTESPYQDERQAIIASRGNVAAILTNERRSVDALHAATGLPVRYLPHSYDPRRHCPGPPQVDLAASAFFHGTLWPERAAMLAGLRDIPDAHIGGYEIDDPELEKEIVPNEVLAARYRSAQVCVNHHRQMREAEGDLIAEGDAESLGPRAYEIAACGGFQVSDYRAELVDVFGDSVPVYRSAGELQDITRHYIAHPIARARLAAQQRAAVAPYSFTNRAAAIVAPLITEVCNA